MNRPTREELTQELDQFDRWLSPTLKKYLDEVEEYMDYLERKVRIHTSTFRGADSGMPPGMNKSGLKSRKPYDLSRGGFKKNKP